MVECCSYMVAECTKDAHVLVRLDVPLRGVFIYKVPPIEMLSILANMMYWVLGYFSLKFARNRS